MQVEASFPADGQALEVVQEREGLLDDVAEFAQVLDRVPLTVEAGQQWEQGGVGLLREPAEEVRGPGADLRVLVAEQFDQDRKLGADRVVGAQCALPGVDGVPRRTVRPSLQVLQPLLVGFGGDLLVVPAQILFGADGCGAPRGGVDAEREVVLVAPINGQTGQQRRVGPAPTGPATAICVRNGTAYGEAEYRVP